VRTGDAGKLGGTLAEKGTNADRRCRKKRTTVATLHKWHQLLAGSVILAIDSLLADAEAAEDLAQQVVGAERAGDLAQCVVRQTQFFGEQVERRV